MKNEECSFYFRNSWSPDIICNLNTLMYLFMRAIANMVEKFLRFFFGWDEIGAGLFLFLGSSRVRAEPSQTEQQKGLSRAKTSQPKKNLKNFWYLQLACPHISTACAFQINWFVIYFLIIDISHVIFHFPPFLLFSFILNDKSVIHSTFCHFL